MSTHTLTTSAIVTQLLRTLCLSVMTTSSSAAPVSECNAQNTGGLRWINASTLAVGGRAFNDTLARYNRLPASALHQVRAEVWDLSTQPAGQFLQFETDASCIFVKYAVGSKYLAMWHYPSTGVSGVDLYAWDATVDTWRWTGTSHPTYPITTSQLASATCPNGVCPSRVFRLHLPPYMAIVGDGISIGVNPTSTVFNNDRSHLGAAKPIIWYGTSILQGAVASRPGQMHTHITSRGLETEIYNFGFSGNGVMELNVAQYFTSIDASMIIIDCNPNMNATTITARTVPLVQFLRKNGHPTTPIVLSEGTMYGVDWAMGNRSSNLLKNNALSAQYKILIAAGVTNLHYAKTENITADAIVSSRVSSSLVDATVGGTHLTDLGMRKQSAFWVKYIKALRNNTAQSVTHRPHQPSSSSQQAPPSQLPQQSQQMQQQQQQQQQHVQRTQQSSSSLGLSEEFLEQEREVSAAMMSGSDEFGLNSERQWSMYIPNNNVNNNNNNNNNINNNNNNNKNNNNNSNEIVNSLSPSSPSSSSLINTSDFILGRPFPKVHRNHTYDRFPMSYANTLGAAVWQLSEMSTGEYLRFTTSAEAIRVNWQLRPVCAQQWFDGCHLFNMPDSGTNAMDVFVFETTTRTWRHYPSSLLHYAESGQAGIYQPPSLAGNVTYLIYLPLRNAPDTITLTPLGSGSLVMEPQGGASDIAPTFEMPPVVWYGTSIQQGGVASRAGNTYDAIITRAISREIYNLGFANNGLMELSIAALIADITEASVIVIDCVRDMTAESITAQTAPFVNYLRSHGHPTTPIVLAEGTPTPEVWFNKSMNGPVPDAGNVALRDQYIALVAVGVSNLHYVSSDQLFMPQLEGEGVEGLDVNPTVCGVESSDLGQYEIAAFYAAFLPTLIKE